jgi:membrane protease YdiL (CAAX protease family)
MKGPFVMNMHDLPAPPGPPVARITPHPRGLVDRVFLDRERRLRVGWRLFSYLTLVLAATAGVAAVLAGSDPPVSRNLLAHLVAVALMVAITWLYRRFVDRRGWRDLGLPLPGRAQLSSAGAGFALGTLTIVGFFGVLRALGWARVDGGEVVERGVAAVAALLAAGLVMYAASALVQELAFRGYWFQNLASGCRPGPPPSSLGSSSPPCTCCRATTSRPCLPWW